MANQKGKFIIVKEDGTDYYKDKDNNIVFFDDIEDACDMIGMIEVDGFVCEIKYHHIEDS